MGAPRAGGHAGRGPIRRVFGCTILRSPVEATLIPVRPNCPTARTFPFAGEATVQHGFAMNYRSIIQYYSYIVCSSCSSPFKSRCVDRS
jgi:hypothetical protein